MILNKQRFEEAYKVLSDKAFKYDKEKPSFNSGLWAREEHYKYDFYNDARIEMDLKSWPEHEGDTKYFLGKISEPFTIVMSDVLKQQNLVSPQNYMKVLLHVYHGSEKIGKEAVDALYELYYGCDDARAFERFAKLMKGIPDPISVVSMYFFLKDKKDGDFQYVIARKEGTSRKLGMLGLHSSCLQKCTWDGYQEYLDLIRQIQDNLLPYHPDVTLLDAQSFLWMMHFLEKG